MNEYKDAVFHTAHMLTSQQAGYNRSQVYGAALALHSAYNERFALVRGELEEAIRDIEKQAGLHPLETPTL